MKLAAGTRKKQWVVKPFDDHCTALAKSLKVSPLIAQVLINRGITDARSGLLFLRPRLTDLIRPEQMPGVAPAVTRVTQALKKKEKITIYGDYDVDGITGVAILWQLLTMLGGDVDYYIPHRVEEGYGLNADAVRSLAADGTGLMITVDCGVTALDSAGLAGELGMDLVITDHHRPGPALPKAVAVVHPALDRSYPNQDSSGAMVAFKLAWALANHLSGGEKLEPAMRDFMLNATTLAAIGTIADVVDLRGENRVLTSYGLKSLPECSLCGIRALVESAGLTGRGLDSYDIAFRIAPMLNAAGRMGHARLAVELLTTDSELRAERIADYLKHQNHQRRQCERKIFKQVCEMIADRGLHHPDRRTIVVAGENWHTGVIGIVASRVAEKYHRPTIIINLAEHTSQGSGRSIDGFDLFEAVAACAEHLVGFGGHEMAAGITIETAKIAQFASDFEDRARLKLTDEDQVSKLRIDAAASLDNFSYEVVNQMRMLEPFGRGNPRPVFATKGVRLASAPRKVGARADHLQLAITDNKASVRCIGFGMGKLEKKLLDHEFFNVAYEPKINTFNGSSNVEFVLTDIQFE